MGIPSYLVKTWGTRGSVGLPVLGSSVKLERKRGIFQQRVRASRTEEKNRCKYCKQDGGEEPGQSRNLLVLWEFNYYQRGKESCKGCYKKSVSWLSAIVSCSGKGAQWHRSLMEIWLKLERDYWANRALTQSSRESVEAGLTFSLSALASGYICICRMESNTNSVFQLF